MSFFLSMLLESAQVSTDCYMILFLAQSTFSVSVCFFVVFFLESVIKLYSNSESRIRKLRYFRYLVSTIVILNLKRMNFLCHLLFQSCICFLFQFINLKQMGNLLQFKIYSIEIWNVIQKRWNEIKRKNFLNKTWDPEGSSLSLVNMKC